MQQIDWYVRNWVATITLCNEWQSYYKLSIFVMQQLNIGWESLAARPPLNHITPAYSPLS